MTGLRLTLSAALAAAALLPAEASADRVRLVNINGYSVIDDQHLVLNGGASRHYLVTLRNRCRDLRFGVQIATSFPSTTTLSSPHHEYVHAVNSPIRCYIDTVEEVESLEAAEALVEDRTADDDADIRTDR